MPVNRPNIIVVMADQLRPFELGCYGGDQPGLSTPAIDRLSREGTTFEHAVSNCPVCGPARSILLSGRHARTCIGRFGNRDGPGGNPAFMPEYPPHGRDELVDVCLPEALRAVGYHAAAIGKWHVDVWPDRLGFDDYLIPRVHHRHAAQLYTRNGGPEFSPPGYSVDFEADEVARFLRGRDGDADPFFLYYNISPPHCPVADAPQKYRTLIDPADVKLRPNVPDPLPFDDEAFKVYRWDFDYYGLALPHTMRLPEGYDLRHVIAEYLGLVRWVDDTIAKLLDTLEQTGRADDTLVVFTSDHGDRLGSHGLFQKGGLQEESYRIPMIFRGPGASARWCEGQVASLIDLAPTLLAIAGGTTPDIWDGQSLSPLLGGDADCLPRRHAFIESGSDGVALRTPGELLAMPDRQREDDLVAHDLADDPFQMRPTTPAPDHALAEELRAFNRQTPWLNAGRSSSRLIV